MRRTRTSVALLILLSFVGTPARAQTADTSDAGRVKAAVERIPIGATIKLETRDGEHLKAVLFAADESGIRVKPATRLPEPSRRISYDQIEAIARYQDRVSVGKYAGVGAAIGAGVLLLMLGSAGR